MTYDRSQRPTRGLFDVDAFLAYFRECGFRPNVGSQSYDVGFPSSGKPGWWLVLTVPEEFNLGIQSISFIEPSLLLACHRADQWILENVQ